MDFALVDGSQTAYKISSNLAKLPAFHVPANVKDDAAELVRRLFEALAVARVALSNDYNANLAKSYNALVAQVERWSTVYLQWARDGKRSGKDSKGNAFTGAYSYARWATVAEAYVDEAKSITRENWNAGPTLILISTIKQSAVDLVKLPGKVISGAWDAAAAAAKCAMHPADCVSNNVPWWVLPGLLGIGALAVYRRLR
jgi:hypothetical protein